jgi:hypothetical protein
LLIELKNIFDRGIYEMSSLLKLCAVLIVTILVAGCGSIPMVSKEQDAASKTFSPPSKNMAGIYIFRDKQIEPTTLMKLSIDGTAIGETNAWSYFHIEIPPGGHSLATEGVGGDNVLNFNAEAGKNYFFRQYLIFLGFSDTSRLEAVSESEGKSGVLKCKEGKAFTYAYTAFTPVAPNDKSVITSSDTNSRKSAAQRLRELNELYSEHLISEKDYEVKKQEILKDM